MSNDPTAVGKASAGRWFVSALIVSFIAVGLSTPILRLFAVDMAREFQVPVGIVAQFTTANSIAEVIFALVMSFLAVRFRSKALLLIGVMLVVVSALGCFFAPNFEVMLFFFALEGSGSIMVGINGLTLIGDTLALNRKGKTISYTMSATLLAFLIGTPAVNFIANVAGWRSIFLLFVLPISVAGLAMAFLSVPSASHEESFATGKKSYLGSFKEILLNKSAASCLLGGMLVSAISIGLFSTTFFMEQFSMSRDFVVVIGIMATGVSFGATLVAGQLVNRVGRKTLTIAGVVGSSVLAMLIFLMPNLWLAVTVDMAHVAFAFVGAIAFTSYVLEQAPKSRGSMMSMRTIFASLGDAIGAAVGGGLLVLFAFDLSLSYQMVGFVFGVFGIAASVVFYFLTIDPTKLDPLPQD